MQLYYKEPGNLQINLSETLSLTKEHSALELKQNGTDLPYTLIDPDREDTVQISIRFTLTLLFPCNLVLVRRMHNVQHHLPFDETIAVEEPLPLRLFPWLCSGDHDISTYDQLFHGDCT